MKTKRDFTNVPLRILFAIAVVNLAAGVSWDIRGECGRSRAKSRPHRSRGALTTLRQIRFLKGAASAYFGNLRLHHASSIDELALSPDGKSVVAIDSDQLIVWDAATGLPRWRENVSQHGINLPGAAYGIRALAFSSDSASFCTPGGDQAVIVWDVDSGKHTTVRYEDALPAESKGDQESDAVKAIDVTADGGRWLSATGVASSCGVRTKRFS